MYLTNLAIGLRLETPSRNAKLIGSKFETGINQFDYVAERLHAFGFESLITNYYMAMETIGLGPPEHLAVRREMGGYGGYGDCCQLAAADELR